jgi:hypothetical protein
MQDGDGQRVKETSYENLAYGLPLSSDVSLVWKEAGTDNDIWPEDGSGPRMSLLTPWRPGCTTPSWT